MRSKIVQLDAQAPKGDRQAMWEAIRKLHQGGDTITVKRVWARISPDAPKGRVRDYLIGLEAAGYLTRTEDAVTRGEYIHYRLTRDIGVEAPRVRRDGSEPSSLGREQLWRTLRIVGEVSAPDLAGAASTPASPIAEATASEYCIFLAAAGYLHVTRPGGPGKHARYQLIHSRWTGPLAPMIQRTKQLFDPNTGAVVYSRVTKTEGGQP